MKTRYAAIFCIILLLFSFCFGCGAPENPPAAEPGGSEEGGPEGSGNEPGTEPGDPSAGEEPGGTQEEIKVSRLTFESSLHEELVNWYGRVRADGTATDFSNASAGFEVTFSGTSLKAVIRSRMSDFPAEAKGAPYLYVFVDGQKNYRRATRVDLDGSGEKAEYVLFEGLAEGEHTVKALKCTEVKYGNAALFELETDGAFLPPPEKPKLRFEIIGDSIMSGSESMRTSTPDSLLAESENTLSSYGYVAAKEFDAQVNAITRSGGLISGYKGFPSIPDFYDAYSQIDDTPWDFSRYQPDVILLDLGTNDLGISTPKELLTETYTAFVRHLREKNPSATIICCTGALTTGMDEIVPEIVAELNREGDGAISWFKLPYLRELGHPLETDHRHNGYALAEFIRDSLKLFVE